MWSRSHLFQVIAQAGRFSLALEIEATGLQVTLRGHSINFLFPIHHHISQAGGRTACPHSYTDITHVSSLPLYNHAIHAVDLVTAEQLCCHRLALPYHITISRNFSPEDSSHKVLTSLSNKTDSHNFLTRLQL